MGLEECAFSNNLRETTSVRLSIFFGKLVDSLARYEVGRADKFLHGCGEICRRVLHKVLVKVPYHNPKVDPSKAFFKLPKGLDTSSLDALVALSRTGLAPSPSKGELLDVAGVHVSKIFVFN